jgi:hypothetical protein
MIMTDLDMGAILTRLKAAEDRAQYKTTTHNFATINVLAGAQFTVTKPSTVTASKIVSVVVYQGGSGRALIYTGYSTEGLLFRNLGTDTAAVSAGWTYTVTQQV